MSGVGDVNRDGIDDYVIGAPQTFNFAAFFGAGKAYLHSGATGELLHTWIGVAFADTFGLLCAGAGNVIENLSDGADRGAARAALDKIGSVDQRLRKKIEDLKQRFAEK